MRDPNKEAAEQLLGEAVRQMLEEQSVQLTVSTAPIRRKKHWQAVSDDRSKFQKRGRA